MGKLEVATTNKICIKTFKTCPHFQVGVLLKTVWSGLPEVTSKPFLNIPAKVQKNPPRKCNRNYIGNNVKKYIHPVHGWCIWNVNALEESYLSYLNLWHQGHGVLSAAEVYGVIVPRSEELSKALSKDIVDACEFFMGFKNSILNSRHVWRRPKAAFLERDFVQTVKHVAVMIWSCSVASGNRQLAVIDLAMNSASSKTA